MLAHKATHQGKVAVEALLGEPAAFQPQAIPAVVFTDPEIAWAGLTEEQAKAEGIAVEVVRYPWAASGRAMALGRTEGFTKLLIDPESERILGVGIVGVNAGDILTEAVRGDRNGRHGPRPGRIDPPAPDAQRNAGQRGRGVSGHRHRDLSPTTGRTRPERSAGEIGKTGDAAWTYSPLPKRPNGQIIERRRLGLGQLRAAGNRDLNDISGTGC